MARSRKTTPKSPAKLLQEAQAHVTKGHYKTAIPLFKQLLKKQPSTEIQQALADVYQLRAAELAAKDMYKEAVVVWQNAEKLGDNRNQTDYLVWLIQADKIVAAWQWFTQSDDNNSDLSQFEPILHQWLAYQLLIGHNTQAIQTILPEQHPILRDYAIVQKALTAYAQQQDDEANQYLKQIPFRSAYKDFRQVLKSLISHDPQWLSKVHQDSPFYAFSAWLQSVFSQSIANIKPEQQPLAASITGQPLKKLNLIHRLQNTPLTSAKTKLNFLLKQKELLAEPVIQQACQQLLVQYPKGIPQYNQHVSALSKFDHNRIIALHYEYKQRYETALDSWRACLNVLPKKERLQHAQILRHMAKLATKVEYHHTDPTEYLADSLQFDRQHKPTYMALIENSSHSEYQHWVTQATRLFPKDADILLIAVQAAYTKKAYKKAVGFAQKLLTMDSINPEAKNLLINAHLLHAKKLVSGKGKNKYPLAHKEYAAALKYAQGQQIAKINYHQIITQSLEGTLDDIEQQIQQQSQYFTYPLQARFQLSLIVRSFDLTAKPWLTHLPKLPKPTQLDIIETTKYVKHHLQNYEQKLILQTFMDIAPSYQKALKIKFSTDEYLLICQCLQDITHYKLLGKFGQAAQKHDSQQAMFIYYQIYASCSGNPFHLKPHQMDQMEDALELARTHDDQRAISTIVSFLEQAMNPFAQMMGDLWGDDDDYDDYDDYDDSDENPFDEMLHNLFGGRRRR